MTMTSQDVISCIESTGKYWAQPLDTWHESSVVVTSRDSGEQVAEVLWVVGNSLRRKTYVMSCVCISEKELNEELDLLSELPGVNLFNIEKR